MEYRGKLRSAVLYLAVAAGSIVGCTRETSIKKDPSNYPISDRSPASIFVDNEKSKDKMDEAHKDTGKTLRTLTDIFKGISPAY